MSVKDWLTEEERLTYEAATLDPMKVFAGEDLVPLLRSLAASRALVAEIKTRIDRAKMCHYSGGDSGMVFDRYDAQVERERKGWWSVDEKTLGAALALTEADMKVKG